MASTMSRVKRQTSQIAQNAQCPQCQEVGPPQEFAQTYLVRKPLGLRIHKSTFAITYIEPNSTLFGKVYVGDVLSALNEQDITKHEMIEEILKATDQKVKAEFKHGAFSFCKHMGTTVEKIASVEKNSDKDEREKPTGRAVELYAIWIRFQFSLEDRATSLGITLKYDSRDRLTVHSVESGTLGSIHVRAGDVIKEVNDKPLASKTMFQFLVNDSALCKKVVKLLVESPAGGDEAIRDTVEMAADAVEIAKAQIERIKTGQSESVPSALRTDKTPPSMRMTIAEVEKTECLIPSDHDPSKLKPSKTARM